MKLSTYALLLLLSILHVIRGANILLVFPVPTMSHHIIGEQLAKALTEKGHHTTIITPFRTKNKPANYNEVIVDEIIEWQKREF